MEFVKLEFGKRKEASARADYDCCPEDMRQASAGNHAKHFHALLDSQSKLAGTSFLRLLLGSYEQAAVSFLPLVPCFASTAVQSVEDVAKSLRGLTRDDVLDLLQHDVLALPTSYGYCCRSLSPAVLFVSTGCACLEVGERP